jgi:hypothetical protein
VKGEPLPAEHHVARHCNPTDLFINGAGEPFAVKPSAFVPDADGVSVNWLEFFGGARQHNASGVRSVINRQARKSHRLAILSVGAINAIQKAIGTSSLVVVEDPDDRLPPDTNAAHVLIKDTIILQDPAVQDALAFLVQRMDLEKFA